MLGWVAENHFVGRIHGDVGGGVRPVVAESSNSIRGSKKALVYHVKNMIVLFWMLCSMNDKYII